MKVALCMEEGGDQIVLTPEDDRETAILGLMFSIEKRELTVKRGQFYKNQAGYFREGSEKTSTILVLKRPSVGAE